MRKIFLFTALTLIIVFVSGQRSTEAQLSSSFGKNKVHYKDFKWATLETSHFKIYFYRGEEQLARNTEKMAERAYQYLSGTLHHLCPERIPLIIYASSDDFQQTEIIEGFPGEGIGGVTESLKGRIVIPFLGSYREFNHVLIHELTHAFQFDILSEGGAPIGLLSNLYIPLWFIEGMAEYLSEGANPLTEMWLYDAVANDSLPSAGKIEGLEDIRVYRFGESLWAYICAKYGINIIGDLLQELAKTESWDQALQKTTNASWKTIYEDWLTMVRETYVTDKPGFLPISDQANVLIRHKKDDFALNILPAASPDGKYLAFLSDRNFYETIYLASAETGQIIKPLVAGERRGTFETLRFLNTSIAWSPDSKQIAFNAQAGGENAIYLLDIQSSKVVAKLTPDVSSLSFLAWSPDGKQIAFTGAKNGQEDLFVITIANKEVVRLTNDLYANRHPAWSPDGTRIAFTTDTGDFADPTKLQFGPANLAVYDLKTNTTVLLTNDTANNFTPVWSPDGSMIAFVSDRNGLCNIYLLDLAQVDLSQQSPSVNRPIQVTHVNTGVVGLTEDNPALTWSQTSGKLIFSGFDNKGWDIFAIANPATLYREYLAEVGLTEELVTIQQAHTTEEMVGKKDWLYDLPQKESAKIKDYKVRLTPDYIFAGGGGNDQNFIILARLGFSDMLANHSLQIGANFTKIFDESDFLVVYTNLAHRLSYQFFASQFGGDLGTYSMKNAELDLEVERGIGLTLLWPFDKFNRVELGLEGWMVSGDLLKNEAPPPNPSQEGNIQDVVQEASTAEILQDSKIKAIKNKMFFAPCLAYVRDTALYTMMGPLDGSRSRVSISPAIGDFTYLTVAADHRQYFHLTKRSTLALRATVIGSFGENARILKIGGPDTFRGKEYNDDEDSLQGTKIALSSIEYRFPLLPKINFLRGSIFWDMALAWTDKVQPFTINNDMFRLKDLNAAYGVGLRIPVRSPFGIFNLRLDIAQATDLSRTLGERKYLFSIGNDF